MRSSLVGVLQAALSLKNSLQQLGNSWSMNQLLSHRSLTAWGPSCTCQQNSSRSFSTAAAAISRQRPRSQAAPAPQRSASPFRNRRGAPAATHPAGAASTLGISSHSSSSTGGRRHVQPAHAAVSEAVPSPEQDGVQQQQQQCKPRPPGGRSPRRPPYRPTTQRPTEGQQQQLQRPIQPPLQQQLPLQHSWGAWSSSGSQQPQQQQQQQLQQPPPLPPVPWQLQQQQPQPAAAPSAASWSSSPKVAQSRHPKEALYVNMTGVLYKTREFESGYKVLSFKKVDSIDNGALVRRGSSEAWEPGDLEKALAALGGSRSNSSSSRSTDSKSPAQKAAEKWLTVFGYDDISIPVGLHEACRVSGEWSQHPQYGWQIKCAHIEPAPEAPGDPLPLLTALPGVGVATAEAMLKVFGSSVEDVKEVLSLPEKQAVARLTQVPKIGKLKATAIKKAWDKAAVAIDQQAELQRKLKLSPRLAGRICKHFGPDRLSELGAQDIQQAVAINPYALYRVIPGYTLEQAEETAAALGFSPAAPERGAAYLQAQLVKALDNSSICLPWLQAEQQTQQALLDAPWPGWPQGQSLRPAAALLLQEGSVVLEEAQLLGPPQLLEQQQQQQQRQQQHPQQHLHHQHHRQHHKLEQQGLFEFKQIDKDWSDDAFMYLDELYQAEQDTVAFYLRVSKLSCQELQNFQQQLVEQQQQQRQQAPAPSSHRRARKASHSAAADTGSLQLPTAVLAASDEYAGYIDDLQRELSQQFGKPIEFNEGQRAALVLAQQLPVMALTGGPGCGKTLVSQAIVKRWSMDVTSNEIFMAAPTGRAAQRLQEVLSGEAADSVVASTIHRLLGYRNGPAAKRMSSEGQETLAEDTKAGGATLERDLDLGSLCEYNFDNPLPRGDYLVDEVPMMDLALAAALFNALRGGSLSSLMLVGDPDQLPPVGAGQPVADALAEGLLPCIDLRQIYRTAANSAIVTNAHAINRGEMPQFSATWDLRPGYVASDLARHVGQAAAQPGGLAMTGQVLFLRLPDHCAAEDVADAMKEAADQLAPHLDCDMTRDIQALSPIKKGPMGIEELNHRLQALFNPEAKGKVQLSRAKTRYWRVGDRVTHLKNDTQEDVYNGDQGYIESIDPTRATLVVRYPPRAKARRATNSSHDAFDRDSNRVRDGEDSFHRVTYQGADIADMLQPAWATTVHKAQGGEFPVVLLALHKYAGRLLKRQLLYTAVSRAQKLLVIVGTESAIRKCLRETGSEGDSSSWVFRAKLRSARVQAGLPTIQKSVFGPEGWNHV